MTVSDKNLANDVNVAFLRLYAAERTDVILAVRIGGRLVFPDFISSAGQFAILPVRPVSAVKIELIISVRAYLLRFHEDVFFTSVFICNDSIKFDSYWINDFIPTFAGVFDSIVVEVFKNVS